MSRQFSIRPLLRIPIKDSQPHASTGTGKPYPKEMREQVITRHLIGLPRVDNAIRSLQTLVYGLRRKILNLFLVNYAFTFNLE